MQLTNDQANALRQIRGFVRRRDAMAFGLYGAAGTGKSTVIQKIMPLLSGKSGNDAVFAAPTHKAVSVLAEKSAEAGLKIVCSTVQSLVNMQCCQDDDTGEEYFAPLKDVDSAIADYEWVVVDECSMLDTKMFQALMGKCKLYDTRIIVMGDKFQLPPVCESVSPSFAIEGVEMLEVVRHKGYLAQQVINVRDNIKAKNPPLAKSGRDDDGEVCNLSKSKWRDKFLDDLSAGRDVIALAWRNNTVDAINGYIREQLHGKNAPAFIVGERVVFNKPYEPPESSHNFFNSQRCEILNAEPTRYKATDCWLLTFVEQVDEYDFPVHAYVLAPDQIAEYNRQCERRHQAVRSAQRNQRRDMAKLYWSYKKAFAHVKVDYATTVHKSQGSTYDAVYIHQSDILKATSNVGQLLYVAYSRARTGINLI